MQRSSEWMPQVFNTIILEGVPQLTMSQATELRRLITLVDAFYDTQVMPRSSLLAVANRHVLRRQRQTFRWQQTSPWRPLRSQSFLPILRHGRPLVRPETTEPDRRLPPPPPCRPAALTHT